MMDDSFDLAMCAALIQLETAVDFIARYPSVNAKNARNYARDTFKTDCQRAIDACDMPGERF